MSRRLIQRVPKVLNWPQNANGAAVKAAPLNSFSTMERPSRVAVAACSLPSLLLVDIPEDRGGRAVEHAGERFTPGARRKILPERNGDHLVIGFLLNVGG